MARKKKPVDQFDESAMPESHNNGNAGMEAAHQHIDPEEHIDLHEFDLRFPRISGMCWYIKDDDDNPVITATLLIFRSGYELTACLHDRHNGRKCFVNGKCIDEALQRLEKGLETGMLDWKAVRGPAL